jgi:uncharacterized phage-associated protein
LTADDVAAYIVAKRGPLSAMKLQKLVYYAQAWHLVWEDKPLFDDRIEAWANGPVVRELYRQHRGEFTVTAWPSGEPGLLSAQERGSIDAVLDTYGGLSARQLSHLTHSEAPWRDARGDLAPTAPSQVEITQAAMQEFYGALDADEDAPHVAQLDWDAWGEV